MNRTAYKNRHIKEHYDRIKIPDTMARHKAIAENMALFGR